MADNVAITPGTGATVAADDVGGVLYQRVKLGLGVDGAATDAVGGAGVNGAGVTRVTVATDDATIGIITETAPATDTASSGLNGRLQRVAQRLTSVIALLTSTASTDANRLPVAKLDGELTAATSVTSATTIVTLDMAGYTGFTFSFTSAGVASWIAESSDDNTNWISSPRLDLSTGVAGTYGNYGAIVAITGSIYFAMRAGRYLRIRVSSYTSGTVTLVGSRVTTPYAPAANVTYTQGMRAGNASQSGNPVLISASARTTNNAAQADQNTVIPVATSVGVLVEKPFSIPELDWSYVAAASGIANTTTAVTVKAAAGAGLRNYITSFFVMSEALGAATEFAIRDGAAGAVLWRTKIGTSGMTGAQVVLPTPLRGTANTLLEVVTLTASVTGAVYVNMQGYAAP